MVGRRSGSGGVLGRRGAIRVEYVRRAAGLLAGLGLRPGAGPSRQEPAARLSHGTEP